MQVLADERKPAGYHRAIWDGTDTSGRSVSSGIYFVRFTADNFVDTRKVMLLK